MAADTAVEVIDLDRARLIALGPDVFRRLEQGAIFYVRQVDEIHLLAKHILDVLRTRVSAACAEDVKALFHEHRTPAYENLLQLILVLRDIRDSRFLSCLFADLVAGFGLPTPTLIDTGYFRCVFQKEYAALSADPRIPSDLVTSPLPGPEPFLAASNTGGFPHRDIDGPHYTFQINFWFTLHPVPAENSLPLFPDIYKRDVPYQESHANLRDLRSWGYGEPLRRALAFGDLVLFHSQHFHASPTEAPELDRLTTEFRVASACIDDNGTAYRRLFWNSRNFAPLRSAGGPDRATRLHPHAPAPAADDALTAQELFAALFPRAEDSRRCSNLWTPDEIFAASIELPVAQLDPLMDRLTAAPFAEDRQLAVARYLLYWKHGDRARAVLMDIARRTESYVFALETARIAGAAQFWLEAGQALLRAAHLADRSDVAIGRYRGDVPTRPISRLQIIPEDARRAAAALITALRDYLADPAGKPAPLLDHRLFFPSMVTAMRFADGVALMVLTLLIFVPAHRVAEVGLRLEPDGSGGEAVRGDFDPLRIVLDQSGIAIAYDGDELRRKLAGRAAPAVTMR